MTLLLDTHAMLWFFWDDPQLSSRARASIEDPLNHKLVSLATCWEVAIKASLGKLELGEPCFSYLQRELALNNFQLLATSLAHVTAVEGLPLHHRDPFDRLLASQAMQEGIPLVSADPIFDSYGVNRLW